MRASPVALLLLGLVACSSPDQPGQLTADQNARLNSAAEMLDANSMAFEDADNLSTPGENEQ